MVQVHPPDFFIFDGVVWRKILVVHANGTHWKKVSAVMVKANIVKTLDSLDDSCECWEGIENE